MGKPVILGVEGHAVQIMKAAKGEICIELENEEALIQATETLTSELDTRESFGRLGRQYVFKHFNRDILAMQYLNLVRTIVEKTDRMLPDINI